MRVWSHDRWTFPLPDGHRFPLPKYRMLRERLLADGTLAPEDVVEAGPAAWEDLALVHGAAYLGRVRRGELDRREERVLGLPWSPELVERGRRSTQGTVEAMRDALAVGKGANLGGGTHHAGPSSGRGYCLFNDVAVAVCVARREGLLRRVLVVDCDVHQGDGTAEVFARDPDAFTLSIQGGANYPFKKATSDLDVDLPDGTGDDVYLGALAGALDRAHAEFGAPDVVVHLAGADPWEGDGLGRLALTKAGLQERTRLVLDRCRALGVPICVTLAGGYAPDLADTVDVHAATIADLVAF